MSNNVASPCHALARRPDAPCYARAMIELIHLPYSPWSEKALWALDSCGVSYRKRIYQPIFGELELRILLKRARGRVSVPLLRANGKVYADSFQIAQYADAQGGGNALFPRGSEAQITRYDALSERGLSAGRALSLRRVLESDEAMLELVPRKLRGLLGARSLDVARVSIQRTLRKYGAHRVSFEAHERTLCEVLDTLRSDLARSPHAAEPKTLLPTFSYADITMAQVLAFVAPPEALPLKRSNRRAFHDARVATHYGDLIAWRDALYGAYRAPGRARSAA